VNELECEIEVARIRAEAKATIEMRDIAQTAIDRLTAVLQMTAAEHEMGACRKVFPGTICKGVALC
jgi:hypothetical protein